MRRWCLSLAVVALACASPLKAAVNLYTWAQEMALGKQLAAEVERDAKLVDDPALLAYLDHLTQRLASHSDVAIPVSVKVIESGEIDAFTLPGGHIYIDSAMLKLTESEAELAFVLAHEIGHVAARHATRRASDLKLAKAGAFPLILFGGGWAAAARDLVAPLGTHGVARAFETEADRRGIAYLAQSGYDPAAAVVMFERIESVEHKTPGRIARLYNDHPVTAARIAKAEKQLQALENTASEWVIDTSAYEEMRLRIKAVEDAREQRAGISAADRDRDAQR